MILLADYRPYVNVEMSMFFAGAIFFFWGGDDRMLLHRHPATEQDTESGHGGQILVEF